MKTPTEQNFKQNYALLQSHLKAKGLMPITVEAYSRTIRRMGGYFNGDLNDLSEA